MRKDWRSKQPKRPGERKRGFTREERRRLLQLGASAALFALALLGRSAFPGQFAQWSDALRQDADFKAAFAQLGEATAQGEPLLDALGELCVQVFGGSGDVTETGGAKLFGEVPTYSQRSHLWQDELEDARWGD